MSDPDRHYKSVIISLGISDKSLRNKCKELFRLLDYRQRNTGSYEFCKYYVCAEIASKLLEKPLDRKMVMKKCGATAQVYQDGLAYVMGVLQINFTVSLEQLAEKLELSHCCDLAKSIIAHYKREHTARVPAQLRKDLKFHESLMQCCALVLASELHRSNLDVAKLLEIAGVSRDQFVTTLKQMRELSLKLLFPSGIPYSEATEIEVLGNAPPKKKQKTTTSSTSSSSNMSWLNLQESDLRPPKITLDTPIDKILVDALKKEEEAFVEQLKKVCVLCTPATSMETKSMEDKRQEDDEHYREWRQSMVDEAKRERERLKELENAKRAKASSTQTTISFPKASSSNATE